ncbi:glycosyl transferase [Ahniella affigens]|uniref:Glycosyl transferase n=1 Tax=Ahniella affigens TaxID=2021234 RepID=A0A2P1PS11_9GAMM|nr:glycosyltransferase family 1 protein [Ahniella affigens]AVP97615.1 glycosyl transferase [Ahniella affigens]
MRIGIVTETYPPEINGVALTVQTMVHELLQLGHSVDLTRPRQLGESEIAPRAMLVERLLAGSRVPRYPELRFGWPATETLKQAWRSQGVAAVYVATEGPLGWSAVRAARAIGIPVLTGFHTRFDDFVGHYGARLLVPLAQVWLRRFHNAANATLVPTQSLKSELEQRGFKHVERLPRGVDSRLFNAGRRDEALRRAWGVAPDEQAVIHVGRLAPEKNLGLLVQACRRIQARGIRAKFIWVGDGPSRSALAEQNPDFIFAGIRRGEDLARHFASGDLFLFPSLTETFGNVTLEAMASGMPLVAFDYGAAHEHVVHRRTGLLAPFGEAEAFLALAEELACDRALRHRIATQVREAVSGLSQTAVATQLVRLFEQAMPTECAA